ncbi:pre-RNA processing PIH1/Nop17-domain-containing protein [Flammula alnicola]|nr:pre-RNA processing PIH1/Nop17-domain-containing protein [Flammula alnicola]
MSICSHALLNPKWQRIQRTRVMSSPSHVRIELAPKPGFCVKSSTLTAAVLPTPPSGSKVKENANLLEPAPGPIPVAKGLKVFVNIAWDANVPPPPEGSEDAIQRAMQGEDVDEENPSGWYVPVIVSNARQDKDKAGNSSLVFDCIYNTTVKSRTLRDPEFKVFLVELALQRIEAQTGLALSRNIGTPNISSKGKLLPRTVQVPSALLPALTGAPSSSSLSSSKSTANAPKLTGSNAPLIQEISTDERAANGSTRTHTGSASSSSNLDSTIEPTSEPTSAPALSKKHAAGGSSDRDSSLPGLRGILKKPAATAPPDPLQMGLPPRHLQTKPRRTIRSTGRGRKTMRAVCGSTSMCLGW